MIWIMRCDRGPSSRWNNLMNGLVSQKPLSWAERATMRRMIPIYSPAPVWAPIKTYLNKQVLRACNLLIKISHIWLESLVRNLHVRLIIIIYIFTHLVLILFDCGVVRLQYTKIFEEKWKFPELFLSFSWWCCCSTILSLDEEGEK